MVTYKLFRCKNGKLYPLYVEAKREMEIGKTLYAQCGEKLDDTHVKASGCGGRLSLRPGFHSTMIPFTDWIGKRDEDGKLLQRKDTVWCECEVFGDQLEVKSKSGLRTIPNGWYFFKTNAKQKDPWVISNTLIINRVLSNDEVADICKQYGIEAQKTEY